MSTLIALFSYFFAASFFLLVFLWDIRREDTWVSIVFVGTFLLSVVTTLAILGRILRAVNV